MPRMLSTPAMVMHEHSLAPTACAQLRPPPLAHSCAHRLHAAPTASTQLRAPLDKAQPHCGGHHFAVTRPCAWSALPQLLLPRPLAVAAPRCQDRWHVAFVHHGACMRSGSPGASLIAWAVRAPHARAHVRRHLPRVTLQEPGLLLCSGGVRLRQHAVAPLHGYDGCWQSVLSVIGSTAADMCCHQCPIRHVHPLSLSEGAGDAFKTR